LRIATEVGTTTEVREVQEEKTDSPRAVTDVGGQGGAKVKSFITDAYNKCRYPNGDNRSATIKRVVGNGVHCVWSGDERLSTTSTTSRVDRRWRSRRLQGETGV